jgi:hypothetical protein
MPSTPDENAGSFVARKQGEIGHGPKYSHSKTAPAKASTNSVDQTNAGDTLGSLPKSELSRSPSDIASILCVARPAAAISNLSPGVAPLADVARIDLDQTLRK